MPGAKGVKSEEMQKKEPTEEETLRAGGISEDGTAAMVGDW